MLKKALCILLCFLLLGGCRPVEDGNVASHIVTEIIITCQSCTDFSRRYYNTHKKMQPILLYLRSVSPGFAPNTDPQTLSGREIQITLRKADGTTKLYRQKNDRYLQEGNGPWRQIKPEWGSTLYQLLLENESDPEPQRQLHLPLPGYWRYWQCLQQVTGAALCEKTPVP